MPFDRSKYPANWQEISRRVKERDGFKCKFCGVQDGATGYRDSAGKFHPTSPEQLETMILVDEDRIRAIKIVLTVAHLHDPDPMNCEDDNLAALCQRCHNRLDMPMRQSNARRTRDRKRGQLNLEDA